MKTAVKLPFKAALAVASLILAMPSAHADDHGNTASTATGIVSGITSGSIGGYADTDWFLFRPTVSGPATVSMLPNPIGSVQGQFFVEWLNASQWPIANSQGNRMSQIVSAGQTYFFRIRKLANMPLRLPAYRLKLSLPEGAMPFAATTTTIRASLETVQDANLFSFAMPTPGLVNINTCPTMAGRAPLKLFIELFDGAGRSLGRQWNNDIRQILPAAGRYFVRVIPDTVAPNTGAYSIQLLTNSRALPVDTSYSGNFDVLDDRDYLRFTVSRAGLVRIASTGIPNIRASLYNTSSSRIALWNFTGNVAINKILAPGTYYLLLEPNPSGGRTGNYRMIITR